MSYRFWGIGLIHDGLLYRLIYLWYIRCWIHGLLIYRICTWWLSFSCFIFSI
jgi:hypothetical protein